MKVRLRGNSPVVVKGITVKKGETIEVPLTTFEYNLNWRTRLYRIKDIKPVSREIKPAWSNESGKPSPGKKKSRAKKKKEKIENDTTRSMVRP